VILNDKNMSVSAKDVREYLRKIGRRGAEVTNQKLTKEQRSESARRASQARWAKSKKKTNLPQ
jgi:hypothetical protein